MSSAWALSLSQFFWSSLARLTVKQAQCTLTHGQWSLSSHSPSCSREEISLCEKWRRCQSSFAQHTKTWLWPSSPVSTCSVLVSVSSSSGLSARKHGSTYASLALWPFWRKLPRPMPSNSRKIPNSRSSHSFQMCGSSALICSFWAWPFQECSYLDLDFWSSSMLLNSAITSSNRRWPTRKSSHATMTVTPNCESL